MIKVVILDFDDTLCLTEEACFNLENKIAQDMGHTPMNRKTHQKNWGHPLKQAIVDRIDGINPDEFMKRLEFEIIEFVKSGKLDSVSQRNLNILSTLKSKGFKIAVLTSRTFSEVKHLLEENHPLTKLLDKFYHKDNLKYVKPDPRVFNQVLSDFSVKPLECVYIGDAVSDAVAAKGMGMHFIAILESGLRSESDFLNNKVDFFANKFTDILSYIIKL